MSHYGHDEKNVQSAFPERILFYLPDTISGLTYID